MQWLKSTTFCVRTTGFQLRGIDSTPTHILYRIENKHFTEKLQPPPVWPPPCNRLTRVRSAMGLRSCGRSAMKNYLGSLGTVLLTGALILGMGVGAGAQQGPPASQQPMEI